MYLLDTNHCSFLIEGEPTIVERLRTLDNVLAATSIIVAGELWFMAHNSQQKTANLLRVQAFFRRIDVYLIDRSTAEIYGEFKTEILREFGPRERNRRGATQLGEIGLSENDLWIASTALRYSLTVVSTDSDFERMRQVRDFALESWVR